jgi:hypothetical protein
MNAPFLICLILAIAFAVAIPYARRLDRAEYHVQHGPNDGCPECAK